MLESVCVAFRRIVEDVQYVICLTREAEIRGFTFHILPLVYWFQHYVCARVLLKDLDFVLGKKNIEFTVSAFQENATGRYGKRTLRILEPSMISERNVDFPAEMFPSTQSVTPLLRSCEETNDIARIATFGRQKCRARAGWCAGIRYDREKRHLAEAATAHWVWNSLSISLRKPFFLKRSNRATGHVPSKTITMKSSQRQINKPAGSMHMR